MKSLAVLLVLLLIWSAGLLAFAARVERMTPAADPPGADAIVALTGSTGARIEAAMKLLERGKGRRLLVSGVNRATTREDVRTVARGVRRVYDCCVDLGFAASSTMGNGSETAAWARTRGFRTLIVVTADQHMPRALLELRGAMPERTLIPYAVRTSTSRRWWANGRDARAMMLEYTKYLGVLAREAFLALGPADAPAPNPAAPARAEAQR